MKLRLCALLLATIFTPSALPRAAEPAAKTDTSQQVRPRPPAAEARLTFGRREQLHVSNQLGEFPMQLIAPKTRVPVRVKLPTGQKDGPVLVGVMDGGRILHDLGTGELTPARRGQPFTLDAQHQAHFVFEADAGEGLYRVFVASAGRRFTLEFWVGDKLPTDKTK